MKNPYTYARRARCIVAAAVAAAITCCVALGVGCLAGRMQLLPAIMAGSLGWVLAWILATIVLGRIYCSTACPTGALMDAVARLRMAWERRSKGHAKGYSYRAPWTRGRYAVMVAVAACFALGFAGIAALPDPYSAFARMVSVPAAAVRGGAVSLVSCMIAIVTLGVVAAVSWRGGRRLCNTWCPVGSALSLAGRHSLYHPDVNTDLCTGCLKCVSACKAGCINPADMTVDASRCVVCFNCMDACPNSAITYTHDRHRVATPLMQPQLTINAPQAMDRRRFLRMGIVAAATCASATLSAARREEAWDPEPLKPLNTPLPPGIRSRKHFLKHCTACGACTAACPTSVLKAADGATGLLHALQPAMIYGDRACLTDCNACTRVCPSGAITPLTLSEKRRFVIGRARIRLQNCLAYGKGRACGRCARRCPHGAITMTQMPDGHRGPVVDIDLCVGCGQCELVCPSTPYKAITIEGE